MKYKVLFLICIEEFSRENLLSFKFMLLIRMSWIEKKKKVILFHIFYDPVSLITCPFLIFAQELSKERKEMILRLVSGLLDGALDSNMLPGEAAPVDLEEPLESRLEERAVYNRLSLPQRDRKAPCKNFFWKTFTSC